jgi:hypothetical protein
MIPTESSSVSIAFSAPVVPIGTRPARLPVTEPDQKWRPEVINRLQELLRLDEGWDGYNGQPISLLNAHFALRVLEATCSSRTSVPQIVPGTSGDLQIEWHTDRADIELHVRAPNDVFAWHRNASTGPDGEEVILTNNFIVVANWIEDLERPGAAAAAA